MEEKGCLRNAATVFLILVAVALCLFATWWMVVKVDWSTPPAPTPSLNSQGILSTGLLVPACDKYYHIGVFYHYEHKGSYDSSSDWGYAIRMSNEEYQQYCGE